MGSIKIGALSIDKMFVGNSDISKIYLGNDEVSKIYYGDTLIYESQATPQPSGYEVELRGMNGAGERVYVQINDDYTWYYAELDSSGGEGFSIYLTNIPNAYTKSSGYSIGIPNVSKIKIGTQGNPNDNSGPNLTGSTGDFVGLTFTSTGGSDPAYATGDITMTQDSELEFMGDF